MSLAFAFSTKYMAQVTMPNGVVSSCIQANCRTIQAMPETAVTD